MKVEWLSEARNEFREFVTYYATQVGKPYAEKFSRKILRAVAQLEDFPEMGVLKYDTLMGKYGFRALFIAQYVCVYKIENDTVFIYHIADARKNYIYHIFGME
ncbi:MAG: type II toxin-antitoxin system RelE/ParE family toxin [Butyricicoccus pullicaecorum]|jgi:toxin ParE1/3/4|nr:type II toxin-antitoxin system RelE/ParE family toxin [Butyricicoccus pullicaecorum]